MQGRLPEFLGIGVQKGGTTTLQRLLEQHPQVHLPPSKELHYFSLHYGKGEAWYRQQFADAKADQHCGEITPYYLFHPEAPQRIKALLPDVTLLVLLRDPVERALSQVFHSKRLGLEPLPLQQALAAESERLAGADDVLIYGRAPFDKAQSKALAQAFKDKVGPDGAHVIYDPVGGDYCDPALRAIAWEGRYLVVGFPAGIPHLPLNLTLLKSCDVRGVFWGGFAARYPDRNRAHVLQLFRWWEEGSIRPRIDRSWPLERAGEAIAFLADRKAVGKVVVDLRQGA